MAMLKFANNYKFILPLVKYVQKGKPLHLADFHQITYIKNDTWNNKPNTIFKTEIYDNDGMEYEKYAGCIKYRPIVGQIGVFVLEDEYRNRGLGTQILQQTINHMKEYNTTHIWAVAMENDVFWSNVMNKGFKWYEMGELHPSVSGSGYKMGI